MTWSDFKSRIDADDEFRALFEELESMEEIIEAAEKHGYTFTAEDVQDDTELTLEDLAAVTGGTSSVYDVTLLAFKSMLSQHQILGSLN